MADVEVSIVAGLLFAACSEIVRDGSRTST
jgi:hypothetical protein